MAETWQLVSGGIEPGEAAWRAAVRELREETGLSPVELYTLDHISTFYIPELDARSESINFCAVVAADAVVKLNVEHTNYRWVPVESIEAALMWPGQRQGAREVIEEIIRDGPSKPYARVKIG